MHSLAIKQKSPAPARSSKSDDRDRLAKPAQAKPEPARQANDIEDLQAHPVFTRGLLQRKLEIGASNDPLELEADRVAEYVAGTAEPHARHVNVSGPTPAAVRLRATSPHAGGIAAPPIIGEVLNSPGQPLDSGTRAFMEPRFGHDFSNVRVHSDARAARSADAIGARAYTFGSHIAFGEGQYAPQTDAGCRLLSHELAHTVQQHGRPSPRVQRKEVGNQKDISGLQDWTTEDRENNNHRWKTACLTNLNAVDSSQYVKIVERRDFYKWFYEYSTSLGYTTRWALAARLVANGAHQVADMDDDHALANSLFKMANVELQGAMREGNQVIFDNALPKLKALIDGGKLTGAAALNWDMQILAEEQMLVQPLYKSMSPETFEQIDYIARKKFLVKAGLMVAPVWSREDMVWSEKGSTGQNIVEPGLVPEFTGSDLANPPDRWRYGMDLGNQFTPGGSGFDPAANKMPAVAAGYKNGTEFAKVATRHYLHQLDAFLNLERDDRVGPGSDYKSTIGKLSNDEKKFVLADKYPNGGSYSYRFGQFSFITEAEVRAALPADAASKPLVDAFIKRVKAQQANAPGIMQFYVPGL